MRSGVVIFFGSIILIIFILFGSAAAQAEKGVDGGDGSNAANEEQVGDAGWRLKRGAKEVSLEFGFAPMQPTFLSGRKEYDTDGRKLALTTLRFGRVIGTAKGVTFEYLLEVIPFSMALKNEVANPEFVSKKETPNVPETVRRNAFSVGF